MIVMINWCGGVLEDVIERGMGVVCYVVVNSCCSLFDWYIFIMMFELLMNLFFM